MPKVCVKARQQGYWSAGRHWQGGETVADVTEKQLAELKAEPHHFLVATEVKEAPAPAVVPEPQPATAPAPGPANAQSSSGKRR